MLHRGFTSFDGTKSASVSGVPMSDCPRIDIKSVDSIGILVVREYL